MITITINSSEKKIDKEISLSDLLKELGYDKEWMGVAINGDFIPKSKHPQTIIKDQDEIEVLSPVSGG